MNLGLARFCLLACWPCLATSNEDSCMPGTDTFPTPGAALLQTNKAKTIKVAEAAIGKVDQSNIGSESITVTCHFYMALEEVESASIEVYYGKCVTEDGQMYFIYPDVAARRLDAGGKFQLTLEVSDPPDAPPGMPWDLEKARMYKITQQTLLESSESVIQKRRQARGKVQVRSGTKELDILMIRAVYTDYPTSTPSEWRIERELFDISASVKKAIEHSSGGKLLLTRASSRVVTVQMNSNWHETPGCGSATIAAHVKPKVLPQTGVDPDTYSIVEIFVPELIKPAACPYMGFGGQVDAIGQSHFSLLPSPGGCNVLERSAHAQLRLHEIGHCLGLGHADGPYVAKSPSARYDGIHYGFAYPLATTPGTEIMNYGDMQAPMAGQWLVLSYSVSQMAHGGFISEAAGEIKKWTTAVTGPLRLRSFTAPLNQKQSGEYLGVFFDCPECKSRSRYVTSHIIEDLNGKTCTAANQLFRHWNWAADFNFCRFECERNADCEFLMFNAEENPTQCTGCKVLDTTSPGTVGHEKRKVRGYLDDLDTGSIYVSFRGDEGHAEFEESLLFGDFKEKVIVQFDRPELTVHDGQGTELWGELREHDILRGYGMPYTVRVCSIDSSGDFANVAIGTDAGDANKQCLLRAPTTVGPFYLQNVETGLCVHSASSYTAAEGGTMNFYQGCDDVSQPNGGQLKNAFGLVDDSSGTFYLKAFHAGLCVNTLDGGAKEGEEIGTYGTSECSGAKNRFEIVDINAGEGFALRNVESGLCIKPATSPAANSAKLIWSSTCTEVDRVFAFVGEAVCTDGTMKGTFVENTGKRYPDLTAVKINRNLFIFYKKFGTVIKMSAVNSLGTFMGSRYIQLASESDWNEANMKNYWTTGNEYHYNVADVYCEERTTTTTTTTTTRGDITGQDCWGHCGKKGGYCPGFCGAGLVCCERGFSDDPFECNGATGFVTTHHECVQRAVCITTFSGTFIDNLGVRFPGKISVRLGQDLFVFYQIFENSVKMSAVNALGKFVESRYIWPISCSPVNDQCILDNWHSSPSYGYNVADVECQAESEYTFYLKHAASGRCVHNKDQASEKWCYHGPYEGKYLSGCVAGDGCKAYGARADAEEACTNAGSQCGGILQSGKRGNWQIRAGTEPVGNTDETSWVKTTCTVAKQGTTMTFGDECRGEENLFQMVPTDVAGQFYLKNVRGNVCVHTRAPEALNKGELVWWSGCSGTASKNLFTFEWTDSFQGAYYWKHVDSSLCVSPQFWYAPVGGELLYSKRCTEFDLFQLIPKTASLTINGRLLLTFSSIAQAEEFVAGGWNKASVRQAISMSRGVPADYVRIIDMAVVRLSTGSGVSLLAIDQPSNLPPSKDVAVHFEIVFPSDQDIPKDFESSVSETPEIASAQFEKALEKALGAAGITAFSPKVSDFATAESHAPSTNSTAGIGNNATFDDAGYQAVASLCCNLQMEIYIRRMITNQGLELCNEYGLLGLLPWYTCDNGVQNYAALADNLMRSVPPDPCAFVAPNGTCPSSVAPHCSGKADPASHRRRFCSVKA